MAETAAAENEKRTNARYTVIKTLISVGAVITALVLGNGTLGGHGTLVAGLIFCTIGDVLLAVSGELFLRFRDPYFSGGVLSFGIAHVLLCRYLYLAAGSISWTLVFSPITFLILVAGMKMGMLDPGKYKVPISVYSFLVGAFLGFGLNTFAALGVTAVSLRLGIASILFWGSDMVLSLRYFHKGAPKALVIVLLILYFAAIYTLASSSAL
jgi:uncharacterized membrane protein YhhN